MSRFNNIPTSGVIGNLSPESQIELMKQLGVLLESSSQTVSESLSSLANCERNYKAFEISDEVVLVARKTGVSELNLHLGYPFTIFKCSYQKTDIRRVNWTLDFHLRGAQIRSFQRRMLLDKLSDTSASFSLLKINRAKDFSRLLVDTLAALERPLKTLYVDPYGFLGDSITGLYFIDRINDALQATCDYVLSDAAKHLEYFFPSGVRSDSEYREGLRRVQLVLAPDLIDTHHLPILQLLEKSLYAPRLIVLIISRNLFIDIQEGTVKAVHLTQPDVLLRNQNIETYMEDCLSSFLCSLQNTSTDPQQQLNSGDASEQKIVRRRTSEKRERSKILISPFSSDSNKEIPVVDLAQIMELLSQRFQVCLSLGAGSSYELSYLDNLRQGLTQISKNAQDFKLLKDKSLSDLAFLLEQNDIQLALTADSGIAHLLTRLGIQNLTVFSPGFWDSASLVSLSAESPLGFCRFSPVQIPCVRTFNADFSNLVVRAIDGIFQISNGEFVSRLPADLSYELKAFYESLASALFAATGLEITSHSDLCEEYARLQERTVGTEASWLFELYDPQELVKDIIVDPRLPIEDLLDSAWRISPLFKLLGVLYGS